ncbi:aspartate aminotransferase family protein [Jidongwangia harbinensis]|uniref:aspartate aminotransferase family protein n=1 Tax=Jidongwangia harbinensis TaxID=2878561 RepID=UPI001CD9A8CA|nr:aspartate aminotransferase family protein [Jidongwangia harbinensis]MCA2211814.1 aspartate aminotransferase family protein [Jidongwangia harbinensis]
MRAPVADMTYYPVSDTRMVRGEGIYLYDDAGNTYLDCASATFNLSLGYSHPAVVEAVQKQAESLVHLTSSFRSEPVDDLIRGLVACSPENLTKVHLKVGGGSEANEGAIKMAQVATGRREVITLFRSHLGQTMMMTSMSGNAFRKAPFPILFPGSVQVPDPYCFRCFYGQHRDTCALMCVDRLDDFLEYASGGQVAAVVLEPISGNGGNIVAPDGYLNRMREFCDRHGIALILDEIQTGIGRTGRMFAADHFGVRPDAITVGKGLGGSGAQVAAILTNDRLAGLPAHHHSFTYGANLLAAAAANATLDIVGRPEFLANVRTTGRHILDRLADLQRRHDCIGDVRGVGLMIGVEIVDAAGAPAVALTNEIARRGLDHGLILRTSRYGHGNVVKIRPPLILTLDQADEICDRLDAVLAAVTR